MWKWWWTTGLRASFQTKQKNVSSPRGASLKASRGPSWSLILGLSWCGNTYHPRVLKRPRNHFHGAWLILSPSKFWTFGLTESGPGCGHAYLVLVFQPGRPYDFSGQVEKRKRPPPSPQKKAQVLPNPTSRVKLDVVLGLWVWSRIQESGYMITMHLRDACLPNHDLQWHSPVKSVFIQNNMVLFENTLW